jgi:hypothetical protein
MFDLHRFRRLAVVQWAEHGRSYLWFLGIGVAIHFCVMLLIAQGGKDLESLTGQSGMVLYVAGYLITGSLFALRYFSVLSSRDSALTLLMRPASAFEKFLLAFLVVAVLYPLAYTLAFQICNLPGAVLGEMARDRKLVMNPNQVWLMSRTYGPYLPFDDPKDLGMHLQLILGSMSIQAVITAGTLYFRRLAMLKTLVAVFVLMVVLLPLLAMATGASVDLLFWDSRSDTTPGLRAWLAVLWIGVPALLWSSTFFLLRERELQ